MKRLVLAWAATAVAATGAAVAVLGLVGGALTGSSGEVMTQDEARAALATASARQPAPATTTPGPSAQPTSQGGEFVRSPGGTVIASCDGDRATLRSWSPAQGYSVDGVEPGPALEVQVEFEADEGEDVELTIGCRGGRPVTLTG
ncbi:hypothetical protein ACBI99_26000 [Nonomuraea sp. ATR24]|uniref:hypothetical protein n=1 Tax=Nonomuraea TaxID=83681 RepID=UPI001C600198|nr:hypothetical protein [Nonomuraea ceibae]